MLNMYVCGERSRPTIVPASATVDATIMNSWDALAQKHATDLKTLHMPKGRFLCDCGGCFGHGIVVSKSTRTRHRRIKGQVQLPSNDPEDVEAEFGGKGVAEFRYRSLFLQREMSVPYSLVCIMLCSLSAVC